MRRSVEVHSLRAARVWKNVAEDVCSLGEFMAAARLVVPVGLSGAVVVCQWPALPEMWEILVWCEAGDLGSMYFKNFRDTLGCLYVLGCRCVFADVERTPRLGVWLNRSGWQEISENRWATNLVAKC